jgi:rhodanese-related sulfurtransferase
MKKLLALLLTLSFLFMVGCSKEEDKVDEFDTLITYLEGQSADYGQWVNTLNGWIVNYSGLNLDNYFILDLRSSTDFAAFHLDNAVNSTLGGMFDAVKNADKPILCVCYTGQTASYAHTLLRLKGIEAYVLKFGMSIVRQDLDKWTGNCYDGYIEDPNWVTTASAALPSFAYPTLNTSKETAEEIMDARIDAAVADWGTRLINASTVMSNPDNYNIMNYWSASEYDKYGHIKGAYQLTPKTLTKDANLSVFDPAGNNILYCYTGQTAAATIAYLDILGYDVKSIKFGTNAMIWSTLESHKWPKPWSGN